MNVRGGMGRMRESNGGEMGTTGIAQQLKKRVKKIR